MKTYDEMIKHAGDILTIAVNRCDYESYAKAEGYAEAIALTFDEDYQETWNRVYDEAEKIMLRNVENGDRRAKNRWDKFWGLNDYFGCRIVNR